MLFKSYGQQDGGFSLEFIFRKTLRQSTPGVENRVDVLTAKVEGWTGFGRSQAVVEMEG